MNLLSASHKATPESPTIGPENNGSGARGKLVYGRIILPIEESEIKTILPRKADWEKFLEVMHIYKDSVDPLPLLVEFGTIFSREYPSFVENHALTAVALEALGKKVEASHSYFKLFELYNLQGEPQAARACLLKAVTLAGFQAPFIDRIPRAILQELRGDKEHSTLTHQSEHFEGCLTEIQLLSGERKTCFVSYDHNDQVTSRWLQEQLVPDLNLAGFEVLSCLGFEEDSPRYTEVIELARKSDHVLLLGSPEVKIELEQRKLTTGVQQEMRLVNRRFNDSANHGALFALLLGSDRSSCLPEYYFLKEPQVIVESDFRINYCINMLKLLCKMRSIPESKCCELQGRIASPADVDGSKRAPNLIEDVIQAVADRVQHFGSAPPCVDFTGREDVLKELHVLLKNESRVGLVGGAGIGKTEIVRQYAKRFRTRYDWVYTLQADTSKNLMNGFLALAEFLGISKEQSESQILSLVQRTLEKYPTPYLLIVDGVDSREAFDFIHGQLPQSGGKILLTSRLRYLNILNIRCIDINTWSQEEAASFVMKATSTHDLYQATLLSQQLGEYPLALAIATRFIRSKKRSLHEFTLAWSQKGLRVLEGDSLAVELFACWQRSLDEVIKREDGMLALQMLRAMAFIDSNNIPRSLLEQFHSHGLAIGNAIRHLNQHSLIEGRNSIYKIHPLLQQILLNQLSLIEQYESLTKVASAVKATSGQSHTTLIYKHLCKLISQFPNDSKEANTLIQLKESFSSL